VNHYGTGVRDGTGRDGTCTITDVLISGSKPHFLSIVVSVSARPQFSDTDTLPIPIISADSDPDANIGQSLIEIKRDLCFVDEIIKRDLCFLQQESGLK